MTSTSAPRSAEEIQALVQCALPDAQRLAELERQAREDFDAGRGWTYISTPTVDPF
jgi:hypothetical protein